MAVHDKWLRASQQRLAFSTCLWQDLLANYGDTEHPHYWRQRPQRMAYQYAIVDHLLSAAKHLTQASLKQLANTRFDDITLLPWAEIESLLVKQDFLSPEAQQILLLLQEGDWKHWIELQQQTDFSVVARPPGETEQLIASHSEGDLTNPDHWPVAGWLKDLQGLQTAIRDSMEEW
jgi:hypothetical protein